MRLRGKADKFEPARHGMRPVDTASTRRFDKMPTEVIFMIILPINQERFLYSIDYKQPFFDERTVGVRIGRQEVERKLETAATTSHRASRSPKDLRTDVDLLRLEGLPIVGELLCRDPRKVGLNDLVKRVPVEAGHFLFRLTRSLEDLCYVTR